MDIKLHHIKVCGIYCIGNLANGKEYIGSSKWKLSFSFIKYKRLSPYENIGNRRACYWGGNGGVHAKSISELAQKIGVSKGSINKALKKGMYKGFSLTYKD